MKNSINLQKAMKETISDIDFLIEIVLTKKRVSFSEFSSKIHFILLELDPITFEVNLLTVNGKKYSKAFEDLKKISVTIFDYRQKIIVEHSNFQQNYFSDSIFDDGKIRKKLVDPLKDVLKRLKAVHKLLNE